MSLTLSDQYILANQRADFAARVTAAVVVTMATALGTANPDPVIQAARVALIRDIIQKPDFATYTFTWMVVAQANVDADEDITDTIILSIVESTFDTVAVQFSPPPSIPVQVQ